MKKTILLGSAAIVILGLMATRRNKKVKNKVLKDAEGVLTTSASKMLHSAKRAAIKELRAKS